MTYLYAIEPSKYIPFRYFHKYYYILKIYQNVPLNLIVEIQRKKRACPMFKRVLSKFTILRDFFSSLGSTYWILE